MTELMRTARAKTAVVEELEGGLEDDLEEDV